MYVCLAYLPYEDESLFTGGNANNNNKKKEKGLPNGHLSATPLNGHKEVNGATNSNESSDAEKDREAKEMAAAEKQQEEGGTTSPDKDEKTESEDLLELLQDTGFTVKILSPGVDPLSIQVKLKFLEKKIANFLILKLLLD